MGDLTYLFNKENLSLNHWITYLIEMMNRLMILHLHWKPWKHWTDVTSYCVGLLSNMHPWSRSQDSNPGPILMVTYFSIIWNVSESLKDKLSHALKWVSNENTLYNLLNLSIYIILHLSISCIYTCILVIVSKCI